MSIIKKHDLEPGDRLVVPKKGLGLINHHGIVLSNNSFYENYIIENNVNTGVRVVSERTFFEGVPSISKIEKFNGDTYLRSQSIAYALNLIGRKYDVMKYNCEHFANEIQWKPIESKQVKKALLALLIILLLIPFIYQIFKSVKK